MRVVAHVYQAEPWLVYTDDESIHGYTLDEIFGEIARQTASDAGSDILESGDEECREELRKDMIKDMERQLRFVGDKYRAPDGVLYTLEENW
jgi:hypothetical protein